MRLIDKVQKEQRRSLVSIAQEYAAKGLTLKRMSEDFKLNYGSLKQALRLRNYIHPYGIELVSTKIFNETKWEFPEYLKLMIEEGMSRNAIAIELGVDNKTIQNYADRIGLSFPYCPSSPKSFDNIINALRARISTRSDLNWIEHNGDKMYIEQWSRHIGISGSTIRKRMAMGWSVEQTLNTKLGDKPLGQSLVQQKRKKPSSKHPWRNSVL